MATVGVRGLRRLSFMLLLVQHKTCNAQNCLI